jgi:hypothetical protein
MDKIQVINALVRTETEVSIKINPRIPYSTLMKEFSDCIFPVQTYTELFKFIAERIATGDRHFIEGIGEIQWDYGQEFTEDLVVLYSTSVECEADVISAEIE